MRKACPSCAVSFEREPGFFLGSIYFNYGLTALIAAIAYPALLFTRTVPEKPLLWGTLAFTLLFPMWFFRYARSLWLGFDQFMDPRERYLTHPQVPDAPDESATEPPRDEPRERPAP